MGKVQHSKHIKLLFISKNDFKNGLFDLIISKVDVTHSLEKLHHFLKASWI